MALSLAAGCASLPGNPLVALEPEPQLPQSESTYLNMGRHLLRSNQPRLAKQAFIRSLRVEGVTAEALTGAGLAYEREGLMRDALRYFQRAARVAPNSVLAHNNLGAALYRLGRHHEAKQAFLAAFALSSGKNRIAERNLGVTELALAREDDTAVGLEPNPMPVQRMGTGEYTLTAPQQVEKEG
jgi:Tfp pilus assembly protein PilF